MLCTSWPLTKHNCRQDPFVLLFRYNWLKSAILCELNRAPIGIPYALIAVFSDQRQNWQQIELNPTYSLQFRTVSLHLAALSAARSMIVSIYIVTHHGFPWWSPVYVKTVWSFSTIRPHQVLADTAARNEMGNEFKYKKDLNLNLFIWSKELFCLYSYLVWVLSTNWYEQELWNSSNGPQAQQLTQAQTTCISILFHTTCIHHWRQKTRKIK